MSMNIVFEAVRQVTVRKTGEVTEQIVRREVWQTPTKVTYHIHNSKDPVTAYAEWIFGSDAYLDQEIEVWDDDDNLIRYETVNYGSDHIRELLQWAEQMENDGYDIRTDIV